MGADIFLWLFGAAYWAAIGASAIQNWWWNFAGKEVITLTQGILTIDKKGALFKKIKSFHLNQAKNFRALEDPGINDGFSRSRQGSLLNPAGNGTIEFDYGMETVKFGDKLYQAEGNYILDRLRAKKADQLIHLPFLQTVIVVFCVFDCRTQLQ
ncbi:hypothetical protein [Mucilaginibacter sp.]|uniref:hypothetical protein n=1 Tax=Mucilaginibacter sp. TaxID=1882438 RepID=UPI0028402B17|nr:hypothetical protein [Mucilaginibacter sp.]MDR3695495.1 hypothetical protein [Mucilaginibacter sp.]